MGRTKKVQESLADMENVLCRKVKKMFRTYMDDMNIDKDGLLVDLIWENKKFKQYVNATFPAAICDLLEASARLGYKCEINFINMETDKPIVVKDNETFNYWGKPVDYNSKRINRSARRGEHYNIKTSEYTLKKFGNESKKRDGNN